MTDLPSSHRNSAVLHWDGHALTGDAQGRSVVATVPARLVSFRHEEFPPAAPEALKAAVRMRAERAFAPLGAVAIDGLLTPPRANRCGALLMALPRTTIEAIRTAVTAQGRILTAVRVAELLAPVPAGGLVQMNGEACLVMVADGNVQAIAALGAADAADLPARLARERQRLGIGADSPGAPASGGALDFLHPTLNAPPPLMARRGVRLGALAAGVAVVVVLWLALTVRDALAARTEAQAIAERLRPLAKTLMEKRADLKEVALWLDTRPSLSPGLHALTQALPALGADEQVHLSRVRQTPGEDAVAEGHAGDRAQMMAFLDRLRRDPRVAFAEIRASRSPAKDSKAVVFELVFRLTDAEKQKATTERKTAPTSEDAERKAGRTSAPGDAPTSRLISIPTGATHAEA